MPTTKIHTCTAAQSPFTVAGCPACAEMTIEEHLAMRTPLDKESVDRAIGFVSGGQLEPRDDGSLWYVNSNGGETMVSPPPGPPPTVRSKVELIGWRIGHAIGVLLGRHDSER
jgi:hypothetical protein